MSYEADTPARAYHLANIAIDIGYTTRHEDERHLEPHDFFRLPDDRGALVGIGTSRLPLSRHTCAETLWRFFDGLGPWPTDCYESHRRWTAHENECIPVIRRGVQMLNNFVEQEITPNPDMIHEMAFTSRYASIMWHQARGQTVGFCIYICKCWIYLATNEMPRPPGLGTHDWFLELQAKRCSKWIKRLDEQHKEAARWKLRADRCDLNGKSHDVLWYCLRALFLMCPWYPTEWYMASWEAKMLPGVQIMLDIFLLMARHFENVGQTELSKRANRQVMDHAFVSGAQDFEAFLMDTRLAAMSWRSKEATDTDQIRKNEEQARIAENLYDRLVTHPTAFDHILRPYTKALSSADFLPSSVLKWHLELLTKSSEGSHAVFAKHRSQCEKAGKACLKGWMAKYHTMTPFKYEVDEVLGYLLDDAEAMPTTSEVLGMVVR